MEYIEVYDLEEQVEDLSKATGIGKNIIRRVLKFQRDFVQDKLSMGYSVNLKGIAKIEPKKRGNNIVLTAQVAQSVVRPTIIRNREMFKDSDEDIKKNMIDDEDLK